MTGGDGRRPWWYSGDPDDGVADGEDPVGDEAHAGTDAGADHDDDEGAQGAVPGVDWTMLVAGAQRLVDWATERVMAPHVEHGDPADHPQCVVCRTLVAVGDPSAMRASMPEESDWQGAAEPPAIVWIPIRDDEDPSSTGH